MCIRDRGSNPSLSTFNSTFHLLFTEVSVREILSPLLAGLESQFSTFNSKIHLLLTEVSVQEALVSLASWVGIPVYLVLLVSFTFY